MDWLVTRKDMLGNRFKSSGEYLPVMVSAPSALVAVQRALSSFDPNYRPLNRTFIAVPMKDAFEVTLRPIREFDYEVNQYSHEL